METSACLIQMEIFLTSRKLTSVYCVFANSYGEEVMYVHFLVALTFIQGRKVRDKEVSCTSLPIRIYLSWLKRGTM